MKAKTPDRIYLIPDGEGSFMWCDDPAPGTDMDEADAIPYVRAALVPPADDEIVAIRARHEAAMPKWQLVGSVGIDAHTDRAALLRAVDRLSAELAKERERRVEVEGALKPFAEARLESWGQRTQGVGDYLTRVWIKTAPNIAFAQARATLTKDTP